MSNLTTSPCRDFPLQMWLLLSDELPDHEERFWQRHLQTCPRCQEKLAEARSLQAHYMRLPFYDAPERVIQQLFQPAKPRRETNGWLRALIRFFSAWLVRPAHQPRLAFAGFVFAMLLLASFHYLAFRPLSQPTWEAAAFDQKALVLASVLEQYGADFGLKIWNSPLSESVLDKQVMALRESLAALAKDVQNSKL